MGMEQFKIRVRPGTSVRGFTVAGAPAALHPGDYVAHWLSTNRPGSAELEPALRFLGAHENQTGDDVQVFKADWPVLQAWPDLDSKSPFELLA